jgi:hypothetical protein
MIVVNTTTPPRPLAIGIPVGSATTAARLVEPAVLKPGVNDIPDTDIFEKSATAKEWIKKRWVEVKRPKTGKDGEAAPGLLGFDADTSLSLVEQCYDIKLMQAFSSVETRAQIKTALSERIAALIEADRKREEGKD